MKDEKPRTAKLFFHPSSFLPHPCSWGHSLNENNHREMAKAEASYMPAPVTVRLCKPAQHREVPFTGAICWR